MNESIDIGAFIAEHWLTIVLALLVAAEAIVALTPSKKDDKIVSVIGGIIRAMANRKKRRSK